VAAGEGHVDAGGSVELERAAVDRRTTAGHALLKSGGAARKYLDRAALIVDSALDIKFAAVAGGKGARIDDRVAPGVDGKR